MEEGGQDGGGRERQRERQRETGREGVGEGRRRVYRGALVGLSRRYTRRDHTPIRSRRSRRYTRLYPLSPCPVSPCGAVLGLSVAAGC